MLPVNESIAPDTSAGKTIFQGRCARCHDLPLPDQYTVPRWEGILASMMPKARLTKEQQVHITAYLKAHAAK
jgi:cytochrome c2